MKRILIITPLLMAMANCATDEAQVAVDAANPAATYCVDEGGTYDIRTGSDGGQVGICVLPDGSEVDAWDYFRENAG